MTHEWVHPKKETVITNEFTPVKLSTLPDGRRCAGVEMVSEEGVRGELVLSPVNPAFNFVKLNIFFHPKSAQEVATAFKHSILLKVGDIEYEFKAKREDMQRCLGEVAAKKDVAVLFEGYSRRWDMKGDLVQRPIYMNQKDIRRGIDVKLVMAY